MWLGTSAKISATPSAEGMSDSYLRHEVRSAKLAAPLHTACWTAGKAIMRLRRAKLGAPIMLPVRTQLLHHFFAIHILVLCFTRDAHGL